MFADDGIWVAGEALIDLVPDASMNRVAIVGGGPANTAKSLAHLGYTTHFIGGISTDLHGEAITEELKMYGVNLELAHYSELPTATASVTLDETGSAQYEFSLLNTATFNFQSSWLPHGSPRVLHVGTLATIVEPGANELWTWARGLKAPIVFDPNVRPSVMANRDLYRDYVEKWMLISSVVKMSEEDFVWLYPNLKSGRDLLSFGPHFVVITHGERGLTAHHSTFSVSVPGVKVDVADTVGAGDTVGAIVVESIVNLGLEQTQSQVVEVLHRAARAAAITCSRNGARPPSNHELSNL